MSRIIPGAFIPVFSVSLPVCLVCQVNQRLSPSSCFSQKHVFPRPPGLDPCLSWPFFLPWPRDCLMPCTVWTLTWFMDSRLYPTCLLPTPGVIINIGVQPSASCVCIWVSPCVLILTVDKNVLWFYKEMSGVYWWKHSRVDTLVDRLLNNWWLILQWNTISRKENVHFGSCCRWKLMSLV